MKTPQTNGPGPAAFKGGPGSAGAPPLQGAVRLATFFLRYLRPVRGLMILLGITTVLISLVRLPISFLPKYFTQYFSDRSFLMRYLAVVLAVIVLGWIVGVLNSYLRVYIGETLVRTLRYRAFGNLERLSMLSVFAQGPGQFVQQLGRDVFILRDLFTDTIFGTASDVAGGATALISMFCLDRSLTLAVIVVFAAMAWAIRLANVRVANNARQGRELNQDIMGRLVENVGGFRDIVAAGRFGQFVDQFDQLLLASQRVNVRTSLWAQVSGLLPNMLISLAVLAVYFIGLQRYHDVSQVGEIITYVVLLSQVYPAIQSASRATTTLALAVPSMQALRTTLDQPEEIGRAEAVPLKETIRSIRFDHLTLELEGRRILDDMSFEIPSGKLTAIVGGSGSGKTTLFHIMLRLMEPTSGAILINGHPLRSYTLETLREHIGFIPQTPFIFNQSLRENILLATPEKIAPERLAAAVDMAQLSEMVARRQHEGGLEAVAGYMGNRLSGGEKQRVALARLLLRDPEMIICDEYTANVDARTARLIQESMQTHFAGRTRVVITHELYSARGADWIIVINQGRVVQQGTHEQLREQPGMYRDLLEVQTI